MNRIDNIIQYLIHRSKSIGQAVIYITLLLYYAWQRPDTPAWAKRIILGALAYLVAPIDSIPDLTPFIGFTDDMGVLSFSLVAIACYVDDEVKSIARGSLAKIFDKIDTDVLEHIDAKL